MHKIFSLLGFFLISIIIVFLLIFVMIDSNLFNLKQKLYSTYPNIEVRKKIFNKKSIMNNLKNDYNVKFLPSTQFENLNYKKKKIVFDNNLVSKSTNFDQSISYKRYNSFFIDYYDKNIFITDRSGNLFFFDQEKLFSNKKEIFAKSIENNLISSRVFDSFIFDGKIFVSFTSNQNGCNTININFAELNYKKLIFKKFFNPKECNKTGSPGRIQLYEYQNMKGLLLSTAEGEKDKPGINTQNKNSIYGKILFIPLNGDKSSIFSLGHRVIQGLNVNENNIIATEHGPRGGDEINLILNQKNYGWPIVSLGEKYNLNQENKILSYKKNHKANNFEEPIFSFIPSVGISEIIKLPNTFSVYYDNHYLLSSLNGGSIFLIRFSNNLKKILTLEKVFIDNRIRDLKYLKDFNSIILALEENGEIGILSKR